MPTIVDPSDTRKDAFMRGFWKGLAAPLLVYSELTLPDAAKPLAYSPLERRPQPKVSDWTKVGQTLRAAANKVRESDRD